MEDINGWRGDFVADVASKLSARQRETLIRGEGSLSICRRLREKHLADRVEGTGMHWEAYPKLSSLGYAVRAYCLKEAGHVA